MSAAAFADPPVNIKTLNDFVIWMNDKYQLQVPTQTDFPQGTIYYQMWGLSVGVSDDPIPGVLKRATATTPTVVANLSSTVFMDVRQASTVGATG